MINYQQNMNAIDELNAFHQLGLTALAEGNFEEATNAFRQAIAIEPRVPAVYLNLGVAFKAMGDPASAQTAYQNALALNPDLPEAHHNLAAILAEIDPEQSVNSYRRA